MGITSENVATQYHIDRKTQDAFALASYTKALNAQKNGWFKEEILPIARKQADGTTVGCSGTSRKSNCDLLDSTLCL